MRKISLMFIVTGLLFTTSFTSCKKESSPLIEASPTHTQNDDYAHRLDNLSANYLHNHPKGNTANKPPKWLRVLGADLKGALSGGAAGAAAGSIIPGVGSAAGGAIGAAAGGASASIEAASASGIAASISGYNPTGNSNNPEDPIGLYHYLCINAAATNSSNYEINGVYDNHTFYNFSYDFFVSSGLVPSDAGQAFTLSMSNDNLSLVNANQALTESEFTIMLFNSGKISQPVKNALVNYFDCLNANPNAGDFTSYSINAENIIVQSTTLSTNEKKLILMVMATGRNGIQYWSNF